MPPDNATYIVQGEINLVVTAMKKNTRWPSGHKQQDEDIDPLLNAFSQLKDVLYNIPCFTDIPAGDLLTPFLAVIRSEDTTGPITGLALSSINKFIKHGLLDITATGAAVAVENIADAVTHARFVGTDPNNDEVVLMKILHVLNTLLHAPIGQLLSNESVCEIMQSCFRICFEMRLSELLRRSAEHTLMEMVQLLFSQLKNFTEEPKYILKKLKMKAGTAERKLSNKKRRAKPSGKRNVKTPHTISMALDSDGHSQLTYVKTPAEDLKSVEEHIKAAHTAEKPSEAVEKTVRQENRDQGPDVSVTTQTKSQPVDGLPSGTETVTACQEKVTEIVENQEKITESVENVTQSPDNIAGDQEQVADSVKDCQELDKVGLSSDSGVTVEGSDTASEPPGYEHILEDSVDGISSDAENEIFNTRGIKFTSESVKAAPLVPYGLPCVQELFRFLVSLTQPYDRHNSDVMIHMGLSLLTVAMETAADDIQRFNTLMVLVTDDLCKHCTALLHSDRLSLFTASLRLTFITFEALRGRLKLQMEFYLIRLMELISSESTRTDQQELALEYLIQLLHVPGLLTELYANYDIDLYCTNLYEEIMKLLSKNAFPVSGLLPSHILSLDALLVVIDIIERHCHHRSLNGDSCSAQQKIRSNRMRCNENLPTDKEIAAIKLKKKLYLTGTEQFNVKPSRGLAYLHEHGMLDPTDPTQVAQYLRSNPQLDKKQIGELLGARRNEPILQAFLRSFNFEETRIDEAVRMFLETFRLVGEAAVIQYILEHFSDYWHDVNHQPFVNNDAAFTLSYAIIMLNVDQHNANAKKQNIPMSIKDFQRNMRGMNGGTDFDLDMLEETFTSIKNEEIIMPSEQSGPIRENYEWKLLLRRSAIVHFLHAPAGLYDRDIFTLTWGPAVAALSYVFDKSSQQHMVQRALTGFRKCAMIAAHYGLSEVFDNLVISLCKFTGLLNEPVDSLVITLATNTKCQSATKTVFNLTHRHGDMLKEGWKNIIECLVKLFTARLLPDVLVQVEDLVDSRGYLSLYRDDKPVLPRTDSGVLSSIYSYFNPDPVTLRPIDDPDLKASAQAVIDECHLDQIIVDTKFLHNEALNELVKALIYHDNEGEVFVLELLVKVILQNRDRMLVLWSMVHNYFYDIIATVTTHSLLIERAVVGLLRIAVRLLRREDIASQVTSSLDLLLMLNTTVQPSVCRHVVFGLHELLKTNAANIHDSSHWTIIFSLLETYGAGATRETSQEPSSLGYTSDSELFTLPSGSWTLVSRTQVNQFTLDLPDTVSLRPPDSKALTKSCETLTFVVRDAAHVTVYNYERCVKCIRMFVKATVQTKPKKKKMSKSKSQPVNMAAQEEDEPSSAMAVQLLDLLHTLHTRASNIFGSWKDEVSVDNMWTTAWRPVLQGLAVLCCDIRRTVRSQALTYLQRSLLIHDLQTLAPDQWEDCFNRVLFPLLHTLLQPLDPLDPVGVEETRYRASGLLCKVFLQHLTPLLTLPTFTALWMTILDCLDQYIHVDTSDLLRESIPESLKNMLLVMHTAGVLKPHEPQDPLWNLTTDRINSFLPNLKDELFPPPAQPTPEPPQPEIEMHGDSSAPTDTI